MYLVCAVGSGPTCSGVPLDRFSNDVVHFSAGIGRSGTYVGLDYLYDQAMSRGSVKLFDCVRTMRRYRLNMVQTKVKKKQVN